MSRIGKKPVVLPQGTTATLNGNVLTVKGPKGTLEKEFLNDVKITVSATEVQVSLPENPTAFSPVYHGTARALINSMVVGVSEGFKIALEIKGTGYRFTSANPSQLTVIAGYSNPTVLDVPKGLSVELPTQTDLVISGADKREVGAFAAFVRDIRRPEPYHGKGIRYKNENVRHKEGKTAK